MIVAARRGIKHVLLICQTDRLYSMLIDSFVTSKDMGIVATDMGLTIRRYCNLIGQLLKGNSRRTKFRSSAQMLVKCRGDRTSMMDVMRKVRYTADYSKFNSDGS